MHSKLPQYNGVAERMKRAIEERVRCMLCHSKLPKYFWCKAVMAATYLINFSPATALDGDVPQSVWTEKYVFCGYLRVFGYMASVNILKDERSRLDRKSMSCVFLGYSKDKFD